MGSKNLCITAAAALALTCAAGCGQDGITLPGKEGADVGECGEWYPGGGAADAGVTYGSELGDTLPCFVWQSVRSGAQQSSADPATYANAYLSMGEIYLKSTEPDMSALLEAQFGVPAAKAVIFAVAGENCSTCPKLMGGVTASKTELLEDGIIPIGVASFDSIDASQTDAFDLVTADDIVCGDGFDEGLYRTNDPEHFLGDRLSFDAFPYLIGVRLDDMKVMIRTTPDLYYNATQDALDVAKLAQALGVSEE